MRAASSCARRVRGNLETPQLYIGKASCEGNCKDGKPAPAPRALTQPPRRSRAPAAPVAAVPPAAGPVAVAQRPSAPRWSWRRSASSAPDPRTASPSRLGVGPSSASPSRAASLSGRLAARPRQPASTRPSARCTTGSAELVSPTSSSASSATCPAGRLPGRRPAAAYLGSRLPPAAPRLPTGHRRPRIVDVWIDHSGGVASAPTTRWSSARSASRSAIVRWLGLYAHMAISPVLAGSEGNWAQLTHRRRRSRPASSGVHADPDRDGDGVPDSRDRCPKTRGHGGQRVGCPQPRRDPPPAAPTPTSTACATASDTCPGRRSAPRSTSTAAHEPGHPPAVAARAVSPNTAPIAGSAIAVVTWKVRDTSGRLPDPMNLSPDERAPRSPPSKPHPLIDIDWTALIQFGIFLVMMAAAVLGWCSNRFFAVQARRTSRIDGAKDRRRDAGPRHRRDHRLRGPAPQGQTAGGSTLKLRAPRADRQARRARFCPADRPEGHERGPVAPAPGSGRAQARPPTLRRSPGGRPASSGREV